MSNERMTIEEMVENYPDEWLFIVDCEHSENTELLSGRVLVHSKSRDDIYEASGHYKGGAAIHPTLRSY
jgi:WD40 repeat protein